MDCCCLYLISESGVLPALTALAEILRDSSLALGLGVAILLNTYTNGQEKAK